VQWQWAMGSRAAAAPLAGLLPTLIMALARYLAVSAFNLLSRPAVLCSARTRSFSLFPYRPPGRRRSSNHRVYQLFVILRPGRNRVRRRARRASYRRGRRGMGSTASNLLPRPAEQPSSQATGRARSRNGRCRFRPRPPRQRRWIAHITSSRLLDQQGAQHVTASGLASHAWLCVSR
jgi:hypothetical protein